MQRLFWCTHIQLYSRSCFDPDIPGKRCRNAGRCASQCLCLLCESKTQQRSKPILRLELDNFLAGISNGNEAHPRGSSELPPHEHAQRHPPYLGRLNLRNIISTAVPLEGGVLGICHLGTAPSQPTRPPSSPRRAGVPCRTRTGRPASVGTPVAFLPLTPPAEIAASPSPSPFSSCWEEGNGGGTCASP